jgi:hypothetical protein
LGKQDREKVRRHNKMGVEMKREKECESADRKRRKERVRRYKL